MAGIQVTRKITILWADDEIDLLKPHILFLEQKGYQVSTTTNGNDALDLFSQQEFDLVFLDENMPGLSGIETLGKMKASRPDIPVIMITKSEEENIMEQAIGSKIADYLIKPVNPNQILLAIKKNTEKKRLVSEQTTSAYRSAFNEISRDINLAYTYEDWETLYRKLVYWEMELDHSSQEELHQILTMQKKETNAGFSKFIKQNYVSWFGPSPHGKPVLSPNVFSSAVFPVLRETGKMVVIIIDNLRFDQWKTIAPTITEYFKVEREDMHCSILPTATQYSRNAMFAGLMPSDIKKIHPGLWVDEEEDEGRNSMEQELLQKQLNRLGLDCRLSYEKISNLKAGRKVLDNFSNYMGSDLFVIVYNFVDMLSHARTEMEMIRELAGDESAYRSLTLSWFRHSNLLDMLVELSRQKVKVLITADHGSIRVNNPIKVVGDKNTSTNLRYKQGKNLNFNPKDVFEVKDPDAIHLPRQNVSTSYIFAREDDFLVYPNNYNYFANYFRSTFQHGGISMEEMMVPMILLDPL